MFKYKSIIVHVQLVCSRWKVSLTAAVRSCAGYYMSSTWLRESFKNIYSSTKVRPGETETVMVHGFGP